MGRCIRGLGQRQGVNFVSGGLEVAFWAHLVSSCFGFVFRIAYCVSRIAYPVSRGVGNWEEWGLWGRGNWVRFGFVLGSFFRFGRGGLLS